jgi:hypothetical protein
LSKDFEEQAYPNEKVGTKYRLVGHINPYGKLAIGDVVELVQNDGSALPWFKTRFGDREPMYWCQLERISESSTERSTMSKFKVGDRIGLAEKPSVSCSEDDYFNSPDYYVVVEKVGYNNQEDRLYYGIHRVSDDKRISGCGCYREKDLILIGDNKMITPTTEQYPRFKNMNKQDQELFKNGLITIDSQLTSYGTTLLNSVLLDTHAKAMLALHDEIEATKPVEVKG